MQDAAKRRILPVNVDFEGEKMERKKKGGRYRTPARSSGEKKSLKGRYFTTYGEKRGKQTIKRGGESSHNALTYWGKGKRKNQWQVSIVSKRTHPQGEEKKVRLGKDTLIFRIMTDNLRKRGAVQLRLTELSL